MTDQDKTEAQRDAELQSLLDTPEGMAAFCEITAVEEPDGYTGHLMTPAATADILGITTEVLGTWKFLSGKHKRWHGPRFMNVWVGQRSYSIYRLPDVLHWIKTSGLDYPEWSKESVKEHFGQGKREEADSFNAFSGSSPPHADDQGGSK